MNRTAVPAVARRLVGAMLPVEWREPILRDLAELYERKAARRGPVIARIWYWLQVPSFAVRFGLTRIGSRGASHAREGPGRPRVARDAWYDVQHAVRTLVKSPLVAIVSVISLSVGIAASATVFTLASAFLGRDPGPIGEPDRVVAIYTAETEGRLYDETSFQDYLDVASLTDVFGSVGAVRMGVLEWSGGGARDRALVEIVTGNWFDVLGVRPVLGRPFSPAETVVGNAAAVLVLSHAAWVDRFGSDPGIIGRSAELDGRTYTVVGVGPPGLAGRFLGMRVDGWVPVGIPGGTYHATDRELSDRRDRDYTLFARLLPGASIAEAESRLDGLATGLREQYADTWGDQSGLAAGFTVLPVSESRIPPDGRAAMTGLAAFAMVLALMVLLVACANVGGVLSVRAHRRTREVAIRASLGASRWRLVRLLLTDGVLLSATGGALGLLLAGRAVEGIGSLPLPFDAPIRLDTSIDARVLLFTLAVAVGSAMVAGLAPALRGSRPDLQPALRGEDGSGGRRRFGFQRLLAVVQITVATALVAASGLALRSVQAASGLDPGIDARGVALAWKEPPRENMPPEAARRHFLDLADRLEAMPEVGQVALARTADAYFLLEDMSAVRIAAGEDRSEWVAYNAVTPGYMEMLGMRLLSGRPIGAGDRAGAPPVAVVNQAFVDRYWPGSGGLGQRVRVLGWRDFDTALDRPAETLDVVGIVADARVPGETTSPRIWLSFLQDEPVHAVIHARSRTTASALVPVLYRELELTAAETILLAPSSYDSLIGRRFAGNRILSRVFGAAGLFALVLAVLGVYGVVSFAVNRRLREMAIRQAIGASSAHTTRKLIAEGMRLAAAGVIIGLAVAGALAGLARSELNGVSPADPFAIGGAVVLLLLGAFAAAATPARRLLRVHPMDILREE